MFRYFNYLELTSDSVPVTVVISSLSITSAFPKTTLIAYLTALIIESWTPPKRGTRGRLECHLIPLLAIYCCIFALSNAFT